MLFKWIFIIESNLIEIWNMYTQSKITTLQDHSEIVTSLVIINCKIFFNF